MRFRFLLLLVTAAHPAFGCDLCSVYAATEAEVRSGQSLFGGLAEQYTYFNSYQSGGRNAPNPDAEHLNSLVSQVFVGYNFNEHLGLQLNLPVIYRQYSRREASGSDLGISDLSLNANFRFYQHFTEDFSFSWTGLGGIKFPSGNSSHLNPAEEDFASGIAGHDLALGSGSSDGLVGTGLLARWKRWFLTANMQYAIRTEGDFGYQYANDWTWFGGPGAYLVLGDNHTLSVQGIVTGETKGEDTRYGLTSSDTAATIVYVGPQLNFSWSSKLAAQFAADFPVSTTSSGNQITPTLRIRAALTWRF